MRYWLFPVAAIGLLIATMAFAGVPDSIDAQPGSLPLISSQKLDVTEYNRRIFDALAMGERWPAEPMGVALHLLGYGEGARRKEITHWYHEGEDPSTTTVTVLWDGISDDSARGIWHQMDLERSDQGNWRLVEMRRAYRCWRGCNKERFSHNPCP